MRSIASLSLLLSSIALAASPGPRVSQAVECTRDLLTTITDHYVTALWNGTVASLPTLADNVVYNENDNKTDIKVGIFATSLKIDGIQSIYDTVSCATYTEIIVVDPAHPYVIGTQLRITNGKITTIETRVSDKDDWLFNAANTLKYVKMENWDKIPEGKQPSRELLKQTADGYLDAFKDPAAASKVPWGEPCNRLEGGTYVGSGAPTDSCNVGFPTGIDLNQRRYVIDEVYGSVDVFLNFTGAPDSHQFRLENSKLRYVHTITVTNGIDLAPPASL